MIDQEAGVRSQETGGKEGEEMKILRNVIIILLAVVLALAVFVLKTYRDAGQFKTLRPHSPGPCQIVPGLQSSEDITIDPETGMAFISSDDRRPWFSGKKGKQGAIFAYNLLSTPPRLINLTRDFTREFHPHGIGLYIGKDNTRLLFVVNHAGGKQYIEIFKLEGDKLVHLKTVSGPLMISPNDVLPIGPMQFYVTNDHGSASKSGKMLEDYLQLARSYVLYFDGSRFKKVISGLKYANGININSKGDTVYVASTTGRAIEVYRRDRATGSLTWTKQIKLKTAPDNIEVDAQGRLWVGCHPKLLTFVKYAKDPHVHSPSQVMMIKVAEQSNDKITEVYLNDGLPISGSSVAAYYRHNLLIGSVFDPRFLVCKVPTF